MTRLQQAEAAAERAARQYETVETALFQASGLTNAGTWYAWAEKRRRPALDAYFAAERLLTIERLAAVEIQGERQAP